MRVLVCALKVSSERKVKQTFTQSYCKNIWVWYEIKSIIQLSTKKIVDGCSSMDYKNRFQLINDLKISVLETFPQMLSKLSLSVDIFH